MNVLIFSYFGIVFFLLFLGVTFLYNNRSNAGLFFLVFTISTAAWIALNILVFFSTYDQYKLTYLIRGMYIFSLATPYSFIMFLREFGVHKKIVVKEFLYFLSILLFISAVFLFTPYMVQGTFYDLKRSDFYEVLGLLYPIHFFLDVFSIPLGIYIAKKRFGVLSFVDKERLKYLLYGVIFFIFCCIVFLLILPAFDIRMMEKEIIYCFVPFIILSIYSIRRYHFLDIKIFIGKTLVVLISAFSSVFFFYIIKYLGNNLGPGFRQFWGIASGRNETDIFMAIILFSFFYIVLIENLGKSYSRFSDKMMPIKSRIKNVLDFSEMQNVLSVEFKKKLGINYTYLSFQDKKFNPGLYSFFDSTRKPEVYVNDEVFVEENKKYIHKKNLLTQIDSRVSIVLPIKDSNNTCVGLFQIGFKPFNDIFSYEEVEAFKDFTVFLQTHLSYIEIYSKMKLLTIDLDRRVDEKTLQYNALISKLKEFIRYASHEIRAPLANSILLLDCINEEFRKTSMNKKRTFEDLSVLSEELQKVSSLVKTIFSAEKYDLEKVKLFMEEVYLSTFLKDELKLILKVHKSLVTMNIEDDLGCIFCDKIQFRELITNLINNALKFADNKNPRVTFSARKDSQKIFLEIEDNGKGLFSTLNFDKVFDKYGAGSHENSGLGMGLYLCKRIAHLHGWEIETGESQTLGGAKFTVLISLKNSNYERSNNGR